MMHEAIEKLLSLQERDQKIIRTETELGSIEPARQSLGLKRDRTKTVYEAARLKALKIEATRKDLENQVGAKNDQIAKYGNQQLETKKNDEYQALAKEIRTCRRGIYDIEEKQLELMEEAEKMVKEVAAAKIESEKLAADVSAQIEALGKREIELKATLETIKVDRPGLAEAVGQRYVRQYERLSKNKNSSVVVGIDRGICGGCHMKVTPQELVKCQQMKDIITCTNCSRIIYYSRDMDLSPRA